MHEAERPVGVTGASGAQSSGSVATSGSTPSGTNAGGAGTQAASGVAGSGTQSASGGTATSAGTSSGAASGSVSASGTGSGAIGGSGSGASGSAASTGSSQAGSGTSASGTGGGSGSAASGTSDAGSAVDSGPLTLPDGSINAVPASYKGTPYKGVKAQIPGVVFARNYDVGGQGVAFNHPGGITCGDWPGGMPMYRTGLDCVGLSVENAQKPDVTVDGGPASYGEIYVSYCATGEWLDYTVEVLETGTYAVSLNVGAPANLAVSFVFSSAGGAAGPTTGKLNIPASVDQAQPGHEMYHVWQVVPNAGMVALQAGIYVMTFNILASQANFDTFTFTKM
jgi:hypothetical protein